MLAVIAGLLIFLISRWHVVIRLEGEDEITVPYGVEYKDAGATATVEGRGVPAPDRELNVRTRGEVDTSEIGTYTIKYRAWSGLYRGVKVRTVHVEDVIAPVILLESRPEHINFGAEWTDGYSAEDDHDGDLTDQVRVEGSVDTNTLGDYTIVYTVTDAAGNESREERRVSVVDEADPVQGSKIVFLTFDDGPSDYTEQLLEVLAAHNAKATFFTIGTGSDYHKSLIGREFDEGHTVAVHSLTHDYNKIYSSDEEYWADFEAQNDIIEEQTGRRSNIFRFPGGSSNTVSSFNPGIMTRLSQEAAEKGLQYFDWNVESGDAGRVSTADGVYENITTSCESLSNQGVDVLVVLCHDSHKYTVDAMDRVLTWFEENGYTLLPLKKGITECHHTITN